MNARKTRSRTHLKNMGVRRETLQPATPLEGSPSRSSRQLLGQSRETISDNPLRAFLSKALSSHVDRAGGNGDKA